MAKQAPNGIRERQRTCAGTRQDGEACRSFALGESDYCAAHSGQDMVALGQRGGLMAAGNRTVRERLRAAAERNYETIEASLLEALGSTTVQHVTCPNCSHSIPAPVPDARARARLIETWLNQTHGNPAQSVKLEDERATDREIATEADLGRLEELEAELERRRKRASS